MNARPEDVRSDLDPYGEFRNPHVYGVLRAVGLDVDYHRAEGDSLYYRDSDESEVEVLDALGGYGASLFGHNHPRLLARACAILDAKRSFVAQASVRRLAGTLAKRLATLAARGTDRSYVVTLGASGADAIEAAIKHAELELVTAIDVRKLDSEAAFLRYLQRERDGLPVSLAPGFAARAASLLDASGADLATVVALALSRMATAFESRPTFLALEGAFHGKSTGALCLTANPELRAPWRRLRLHVEFLPVGDEAAIRRAIGRATLVYPKLTLSAEGVLDLAPESFVNVAACFCEPIQGEAGIREIPLDYLRSLRRYTSEFGIPLVLDEIQSGMGRTGSFLASEPSGVVGDYVALSKSLGGGLAKVSALLIDRRRYRSEFGLLHTSTFSDDDFGSAVALEALDLVEADDGAILGACREKGAFLLDRLRAVARRFPDQIAEVRGRGLMVGVELRSQVDSSSPFVREAYEQGFLGYVVAGYLLRAERLRAAPTLSSPATLRIQPSALVGFEDLERIATAFERVAILLRAGDGAAFVLAMLGRPRPSSDRQREPEVGRRARREHPTEGSARQARRVAFIGHLLEPVNLREWDPSFAALDEEACRELADRLRGLLGPFVIGTQTVRASSDHALELTVIGVPFTSAQVMESRRAGDAVWIQDEIQRAVQMAEARGCSVIGFGGYTSIATDNCRAIVSSRAVLTTGNALTAAATVKALLKASERRRLRPLRIGIVGALGNIGAVLAEVLAPYAASLLLVGRSGAERRLKERASELRRSLGERSPAVETSTNLAALSGCNTIVTASNAPHPILLPSHIGEGRVLVCDVATPGDVDPGVLAPRPDVEVVAAGTIRLPRGQDLRLPGLTTKDGIIYGCVAETLLLGFDDAKSSFAIGKLTPELVRRAQSLADQYGFLVEEASR